MRVKASDPALLAAASAAAPATVATVATATRSRGAIAWTLATARTLALAGEAVCSNITKCRLHRIGLRVARLPVGARQLVGAVVVHARPDRTANPGKTRAASRLRIALSPALAVAASIGLPIGRLR